MKWLDGDAFRAERIQVTWMPERCEVSTLDEDPSTKRPALKCGPGGSDC